jgi:hypothetical protein
VYPDSNAIYQCSAYTLPEGAALEITAQFPQSRYFTFTLYGDKPGNFYKDQDIIPDEGSINPFVHGNDRLAPNRDYTIRMVSGEIPENPEDRAPNTMYHGNAFDPVYGWFVCTRIYVPDLGTEPFGNTALPEVTLVMPDGSRQVGDEMCETVNAKNHGQTIFPQAIGFDLDTYLGLRDGSRYEGLNTVWTGDNPKGLPDVPVSWPAQDPPEWKAFFNAAHQQCTFFTPWEDCDAGEIENNPDGIGLGNPAGRYMETWIDRNLGQVVAFRGKQPTTPKTWHGESTVPDEDPTNYQLRYFSFCPQESQATWRIGDCIFDEEIAESVDEDGFYTVVFTPPSYRPRNARPECGFAWAPLPAGGDGAGDLFLTNMWMRHHLPASDFAQSATNVQTPGTEKEVMGDYLPEGTYYSVEEFEALGCGGIDFEALPIFEDCGDRCCAAGLTTESLAGQSCTPEDGCEGGFACTCFRGESEGTHMLRTRRLLFGGTPECYCVASN